MIVLRPAEEKDVDALERLAQIPGFINLPSDKDQLREKLQLSERSFHSKLKNKLEAKYIFVAEEVETHKVLGTSMIAHQHGTEESPHFYFEIGKEEKVAESIGTGFIHGTLQLKYDSNGPTEIGGLVIDPDRRNTEERIGRQIAFVRFLFLGMYRQLFKKKVLAELLPPLNKKGQSPLWEAIGRRFTNMDYWEADQLCQKNKEFIFSLFPSGKVYTTFLSAEARNAIGKVGKETEPIAHLLKRIGFQYKNQVDPFDGGPHFWVDVDQIKPIKKIKTGVLAVEPELKIETKSDAKTDHKTDKKVSKKEEGLLAVKTEDPKNFLATAVKVGLSKAGVIEVEPALVETLKTVLKVDLGHEVVFMPFY